MPDIFFISETPPVNTHASSVVFYRHFKRLQLEGYLITWITDKNSFERSRLLLPIEWRTIILPNRAAFLPPYKPKGIPQSWRFYIYYKFYIKKALKRSSEAVLITHIHGQFLTLLAGYIRRRISLPLLSFFHDDPVDLAFTDSITVSYNVGQVLNMSDEILAVSKQLENRWPRFKHKFKLLYPLPEKCEGVAYKIFQLTTESTLTFGYSGAVYDELLVYMSRFASHIAPLGHKLIVIGDIAKIAFLEKQFPETVHCEDFFSSPQKAVDYLIKHCCVGLVPYPEHIKEMPWIRGCFPSKFLQYCQLGLPTVIIAPKDSAIGNWCIENDWPFFTDAYKKDTIDFLIKQLQTNDFGELISRLNKGCFNPDFIHKSFKKAIEASVSKTD